MKQFNISLGLLLLLSLIGITAKAQSSSSAMDTSAVFKEALPLIHMPEPTFDRSGEPPQLDSTQIGDLGFEQVFVSSPKQFRMRDGTLIHAQQFSKSSDTTILVLHGVASSGYTFNRMAGLLQEATNAEVFAIDWRGHGQSGGTPGDVDYADQYVDDLADIVKAIRATSPKERILIAAHSMGGGIALRYAMKSDMPHIDGYILFAPLLGYNSPTQSKEMPETDESVEPFMKIHFSRIFGLYMMNSIGNQDYDSLPVLFLNQPVDSPLASYSYRSFKSMAPDDYKEGLQAISRPLLVIVGSEDEAFVANAYEPAVKEYSSGQVLLVEGQTHNGIRHSTKAIEAVASFIKTMESK